MGSPGPATGRAPLWTRFAPRARPPFGPGCGAARNGCCLRGRRPQRFRALAPVSIDKFETENWKPPTCAPVLFPCAVL